MKHKLFLRRFFASLLLLAVSTLTWAYDFKVDGIYYNKNSDGTSVYVTYDKLGAPSYLYSIMNIPMTVPYGGKTYTVVGIGKNAFYNCSGFVLISIPESVTSIGDYAFFGCSRLTSIYIPDAVTDIGDNAFKNCTSLKSISIGKGLTTIGNKTFENCSGLKEAKFFSIESLCNMSFGTLESNPLYYARHLFINDHEVKDLVIPESVTNIGSYVFSGCEGLTSVTVPNSVTTIGQYAFYNCSSLTSIVIPNSVKSIAALAFDGCTGLTTVTLNSNAIVSNPYTSSDNLNTRFGSQVEEYIIGNDVKSIGVNAFCDCVSLGSIAIPNNVTNIGNAAFDGCTNLTSVNLNSNAIASKAYTSSSNLKHIFGTQVKEYVIGNDVVKIGEYAFYDCSDLTSVSIGDGVTSIGESAFYNSSGLTSITIPNNVTSIGSSAFSGCKGLTSITIPNSVMSIGSSVFSRCSGLTSITIPNSVTSIGNGAFTNCSGLTSITIPNSVTSIGNSAFEKCSGLTSITIPNSVTSIGNSAFANCSGLTSISIPNSVTSIGTFAFDGCTGLIRVEYASIESLCNISFGSIRSNSLCYAKHLYINGSEVKDLVIPNSVTNIGKYAFSGCPGLTSIVIPNSVTTMSDYAFSSCSGLTSVIIGSGVTTICKGAFADCSDLTSVAIGNNVTTIDDFAFRNCTDLTDIAIPESVERISNNAFDGCTSLSVIIDNIRYIDTYLLAVVDKTQSTYNIKEGTKIVGSSAFFGCSNLKSIAIPKGVTSIGSQAFQNCTTLTSVTIPNSVKSIGSQAFQNCTALTSITIPNSVTTIGKESFWGCSNLTSVTLNSNAIVSEEYSFSNSIRDIFDSKVNNYIIGNDVTRIGTYAFYGCYNLKSITIPESVTSIGNYAFEDCSGLSSVIIPKSVTSIGFKAFESCSSLKSVIIGSGVTSIDTHAFKDCSVLYSVTINSDMIVSRNFRRTESNIGTQFGSQVTEFIIGDSVKSIGSYAFYNCPELRSAKIGENVKSIGGSAFSYCTKLASINIPETVVAIDRSAFEGCVELTSVALNSNTIVSKTYDYSINLGTVFGSQVKNYTIGDGVTSIGSYAFYDCPNLTMIKIPNSVTNIGQYAFYCCSGLTSVTIPESVTSIERAAFKNCSGLKSIALPKNLKSISDNTFQNCSKLTSVTMSNAITTIGNNAFQGCSALYSILIPNNVTIVGNYAFQGCSALPSIAIPNSVTSIGSYAFHNCYGLKSLGIGSGVTSIGNCAFRYCYNLTSINIDEKNVKFDSRNNCNAIIDKGTNVLIVGCNNTIIPKDVTMIRSHSFYNCSGLKSITIPNSVTSIADSTFSGCTRLTSVTCITEEIPATGKNVFDRVPHQNAKLYVPITVLENYEQSSPWSGFSNIQPVGDQYLSITNNEKAASSLSCVGECPLIGMLANAEVLSSSFVFDGKTVDGDKIHICGLNPNSAYNFQYLVRVKLDNGGTVTFAKDELFKTDEINLITSQPKVISVGNVIVGAESNLDDAEKNVGFEWRRTDWSEDFVSNTGISYLYEGTMEGYIRNLNSEKLWKFRPYYKSDDGSYFYGDWVGIDPTNTSYFEPTVHTYANISVIGNKVMVTGYVQRGSDAVKTQGFKYWVSESNAREATFVPVSATAVPRDAKTVEAEGRVMEADLTNLDYNTTYSYVAFVTTIEGETFYGKQLAFTTGDDPMDIEDLPAVEEETILVNEEKEENAPIFDLMGRRLTEKPASGYYIQGGKKYFVK